MGSEETGRGKKLNEPERACRPRVESKERTEQREPEVNEIGACERIEGGRRSRGDERNIVVVVVVVVRNSFFVFIVFGFW